MEKFYLPTPHNITQAVLENVYSLNNSLLIFSIHQDVDYPSYYNEGTMFDIDHLPLDTLSLCINSCANLTLTTENDHGDACTGVAYINGLCWRKNGISEDSTSYTNVGAFSAIMHLLDMVPIN